LDRKNGVRRVEKILKKENLMRFCQLMWDGKGSGLRSKSRTTLRTGRKEERAKEKSNKRDSKKRMLGTTSHTGSNTVKRKKIGEGGGRRESWQIRDHTSRGEGN